ncbi:uncharacterized protein LOC113239608 [Hyposmocoma kahamanoa]|uniref:uncharacterized protein LOC113239608 n=1 Tax=Hyposmocoma kahamanoa TaxID=1477025 RepID=UPI000E6DA420|nr:uncharacterized protein LOC113239608 [Hyposmocoma kahamanoa]
MKTYQLLKSHCSKIFFSGTGNYWYEGNAIGNDKSLFYRLYAIILISTYAFMTVLEIMAALIGDFPNDEKSDSVTFAVSHTIVMIKIFSVILNKNLIKSLNKSIATVCETYENPMLMAEKYRIIKINILAYVLVVYGAVAGFVFEGLRKLFSGSHFVTIVTYYPSYEDNSSLATSFRVFTTIVLSVMMVTMIVSVDSFTMMYLIIFKYKVITLRHYFDGLREEFDRNNKSDAKGASEKLSKGLIEGIIMHSELLRILKDIDTAFGTVMAMQLCQSSGSAVSLLLQIALSKDLTFIVGMKIILFVVALFFLLALFLCNAGEITYQASLLSDAIFYCGWHACPSQKPPQRKLGSIVLIACVQAQRPVVMKAFRMIDLTYATFLSVVRMTYSVFALFYAQNK